MSQAQTITGNADDVSFEAEARAAIQWVRLSFAEVLDELGFDPRRPQAVADRLGIGSTLAWRAAQIVVENDALTAIQHLPGTAARKTLLQAFERAGARPETVKAVHEAIENFDRMVEVHADDRDTFDRMLLGLPGERQAERDEAQRRLAFLGNSAIWGVELKTRLSTQVLTPAADGAGEMLDLTAVSGLSRFRWLRANVPWPVFARRYVDDDGAEQTGPRMEPLDPAGDGSSPLWREFCTGKLPEIRRTVDNQGVTRFETVGGTAGNAGQFSWFNAWTDRGACSRWRDPRNEFFEHNVWSSTPVETLVFDLFIHRSIALTIKPTIHILSHLPSGPGGDHRECELPVAEKVVEIPGGPFDLMMPELPAYPRMMAKVFAHTGFDATEFAAYRFRMRFPPIASRAVLRYQLPERP
ncbi:MAG TPA: hypothetical protein VEB22_02435 [Phycisphaerales bacterium]|nr:hypothetical protein [Phycisphaerales bacterium]